MNILFLDQYSDLGGAQQCLIGLIPAVLDRGWRVQVAAPGNGALADRVLALGAGYRTIQSGPYASGGKSIGDLLRFSAELPVLAREIARLGSESSADVIYVNGPRLLPAAWLAFRRKTPLIFHCHSYIRQRYVAALAGIAAAASNATVIGCCRYVTKPFQLYLPADRFEIVYNGVAGGSSIPHKNGSSIWRIGVLGRIAPEKGQLEFVQAARLLPPHCRFTVWGAPLFSNPAAIAYFDNVRQAADGLPVEFPGWCDDINEAMRSVDLLVIPSAPGEATTRVILEAYAAGIPVVASDSGGTSEVISDGETGFLVPASDPVKLAAKIRDVMVQPALRERVARNARCAWSKHYTLAGYQARVLSILESVGANART